MRNQCMSTETIAERGRIMTWNSERRGFKLPPEENAAAAEVE